MKKAKILFGAILMTLSLMVGNVQIVESAPDGNPVTCYEILELCPNSPSFDVYFCGSCSVRMATTYSGPKKCMNYVGVENTNID